MNPTYEKTTTLRTLISAGVLLAASATSTHAFAQAATGSGSISLSPGRVSSDTTASGTAPAPSATGETPYLNRYPADKNLWELGLFGGLMFPSSSHELMDPNATHQPFDTAGELGVRFAYFPLAFLGAELEGAVMPSDVKDGTGGGLYAARGHVIAQFPKYSITPFALIGVGALGASSSSMGTDTDPAFHFGIGAKAALDAYISARLDIRDTMSQKFGASNGTQTHHPEVLLGVTFTLERTQPDRDGDGFADHRDDCPSVKGDNQGCPPPDQDHDGVPDSSDQCKDTAGVAPTGCPDTDGDGKLDAVDACPTEAAPTKTGCPDAQCACKDRDGDGRTDAVDKCPDAAATTEDGCPNDDPDGDGIKGAADKCPTQPETKNGFEDKDGCPDDAPAELKRFSGVIRGIQFAYDSAEIQAASKPLLDDAAKVLKQYTELNLEIAGHTDSQGDRDHNLDLSRRRAESVKAYLVSKGVDAARLKTRGAGANEPIADNKTDAGRQQNRRIEFKPVDR